MYPLSLTGAIYIKMQEKIIQKYQIWDHTGSIHHSNHLQAYGKEYWRLNGYKKIIMEDHKNCLFDKREISYDKASACEKRWETFL